MKLGGCQSVADLLLTVWKQTADNKIASVIQNDRGVVRKPGNCDCCKILNYAHDPTSSEQKAQACANQLAYSKRSDRSYPALEELGGMVLQPQRKKLGCFQCNLLAHARKGYRVVIMTHGSGGAGQVTDEIEARVAAAYHWDSRQSAPPLDSPEDCLC